MGGVTHDAQLARASEEADRLARKGDVIALERRQAEEERTMLDARMAEAQASIGRVLHEQREAEGLLSERQRRLMEARGSAGLLM